MTEPDIVTQSLAALLAAQAALDLADAPIAAAYLAAAIDAFCNRYDIDRDSSGTAVT